MDIKLNFINQSADLNNNSIVIFQKNVATNFEEIAVAWKVIKNCGNGCNHPFVYPMEMYVSGGDSYGNYTPKLKAENGQLFEMVKDGSGDILQLSTEPSASNTEVQLLNSLKKGAINANIFKDGRLLALKTAITPGQKAVFQFKPQLFIGAVAQVEEGQVMNSAIISHINTHISLLGLASADVVMTGGGPGKESTPFRFELRNETYA